MSAGKPIYRAPMRARTVDASAGAGTDFGLDEGLVGIGDALPAARESLAAAVDAAAAAHGAKAARMLDRFATLPDGTLVWTRDTDGLFHLGRIAGPWRYLDSAPARAVGIHHVRPCTWLARPFPGDEVPPAVAATFARGGRNLQRIHGPRAEERTAALWAEHA